MLSIFIIFTSTTLFVKTVHSHPQVKVGLISETGMAVKVSSVHSNSHPVTIRQLVTKNASLMEIVNNICTEIISRRAVAVIGSVNTATDSAVSEFLGHFSVPFVGLNPARSASHFSLFPSALDRFRAILSLSLELASSSVLVFTSSAHSHQLFQALRSQFAMNGVHLHITFINPDGDPAMTILEASQQMLMMNKSDSYLAVLELGLYHVDLVMKAANFLGVSSQQISWVMAGDALDVGLSNVDSIPLGILGIRVPFTPDDLLQDALTLVTQALLDHNAHWSNKDVITHNASCFQVHPSGATGTWLTRVLKTQTFLGTTGLVQFDDVGARVNADYEIVRMVESPPNSSRKWERVGRVSKSTIHLESNFWFSQTNLTANRGLANLIRMVTTEDYPLVIAHRPSLETGTDCILSQPCFKLERMIDPETNASTVRPIKHCCSGYMIDLLRRIQQDLPTMKVELYLVEDGSYGSFNPRTKQWNGMIGDLIQNKADVALTALTINEMRARVVDFSNSFLHGETKIMVSYRKSEEEEIQFGFLKPFDLSLWVAALVMINVFVLLVWWLDRVSPHGHYKAQSGDKRYTFNVPECMSFIWTCVFKLPLNVATPRSHSVRLMSAFFSFGTLILTTSYTANLAAYLVNSNEVVPVSGIRDEKFVNPSSGFKFAGLGSSSTEMTFLHSSDPHYRKIHKNMRFVGSYKEAIEKLESGALDAFIDDSPFLDVLAAKQPGCSFRIVGRPISLHGYGLAFRRGFRFTQPISQLLLKYSRRDYFRALAKKWFESMCTTGDVRAKSLSSGTLSGLFVFCIAVAMTCVPLLLSELLFYRFSKRNAVTYTMNSSTFTDILEQDQNTRL